MSTRIRLFLLTLTGIGLFALGYGTGAWDKSARKRLAQDPAAIEPLPKRSAARGPVSPGSPEAAVTGVPPEPAAGQAQPDLSTVLENPRRKEREHGLEEAGRRDYRSGRDWKAASASIGDRVDRSFYLRGVMEAWAEEDPRAALDHLATTGLSTQSDLVPLVVSLWASSDPESAEAWVLPLDHGEVRDRALEDLYRSWAVLDPEVAVSRSLALEEGEGRFRAFAGVVQEWTSNDPAAAMEWARDLKDPTLKDFAAMAVADEMSVRAPLEAMRWVSGHLAADPRANPEIVALVASKAGFETPLETFEWLKSVPPSPEAASSLAGVATYLVEEDPSFAWEGFARLPDELRSLVGPAIASTLGSRNPDDGLRWLGQQPAGDWRNHSTGAFVSGWMQRDPAEAEAWVEQLPEGPEKEAARNGLTASNGESGGGVSPPRP